MYRPFCMSQLDTQSCRAIVMVCGSWGGWTHTYLFSLMAGSDLSLELLELQKILKKAANMISHLPSVSLRVFLAISRAEGGGGRGGNTQTYTTAEWVALTFLLCTSFSLYYWRVCVCVCAQTWVWNERYVLYWQWSTFSLSPFSSCHLYGNCVILIEICASHLSVYYVLETRK